MTESPPPPAPTLPDPTSPRKRPWTILGRLAQAVREQNWFAVGLEVVIVIVGVVIGFQITAWGAARSDAAREQIYLRQLAEDLRETERLAAEADSALEPAEWSHARLLQAFLRAQPPLEDSLAAWSFEWIDVIPVQPVMGTDDALIATGDLTLIREDSLRIAVTRYAQALFAETERENVRTILTRLEAIRP